MKIIQLLLCATLFLVIGCSGGSGSSSSSGPVATSACAKTLVNTCHANCAKPDGSASVDQCTGPCMGKLGCGFMYYDCNSHCYTSESHVSESCQIICLNKN